VQQFSLFNMQNTGLYPSGSS